MFLNSWSIALAIISLTVIVLVSLAARTAIRVLRYWDVESDSNLQICLENETWLASTLVEYGLGFQIVSLILFALAADNFSQVVIGAMCATGALTANSYGMPALFIKMAGLYLYGFWIVVHHLDISSEKYPLLKFKYIYLVCLFPLLCTDIVLQTLYIAGLTPDIITSCCAVIFGQEGSGRDMNLMGALSREIMLPIYYGSAFILLLTGGWLVVKWRKWLALINAVGWALFLIISFMVITAIFSSYIYAMPYHRCPFCILKPEYNYIGFLIYGTLMPGAFFGISATLVTFFNKQEGIAISIRKYQTIAVKLSLFFLITFVSISSFHYLIYRFWGGEN
jgi:hypothetical protein